MTLANRLFASPPSFWRGVVRCYDLLGGIDGGNNGSASQPGKAWERDWQMVFGDMSQAWTELAIPGPVLSPQALGKAEEQSPGTARQLFDLSEQIGNQRRGKEFKDVKSAFRTETAGMITSFILTLSCLGAAFLLRNHGWIALATVAVMVSLPVIALVKICRRTRAASPIPPETEPFANGWARSRGASDGGGGPGWGSRGGRTGR